MIRQLFEKEFYKLPPPTLEGSRLAWAAVLFLPTRGDQCILSLDASGCWEPHPMDHYSFTAQSHPPMTTPFKLDTNSEAMCVIAKKRPVVLLAAEQFPELWRFATQVKRTRSRLKPQVGWLVVPIYNYDLDADLQQLVETLYFPQFFPLLGNNGCPQYDSFARLDRLQTVHQSVIEPTGYRLGDNIAPMLYEAVVSYITGTLQGNSYAPLRSVFLEELRKVKVIL